MYESMFFVNQIYSRSNYSSLLGIHIPTPFINQYETISSSSVHTQPAVCISLESNASDPIPTVLKLDSITPSLQKTFPIVSIAILGFLELISGLIVLGLEFVIFDITLGLWCGGIYALAGAVILMLGSLQTAIFLSLSSPLVLVFGTDRERHQISAVLIFQLVGKEQSLID